MPLDATRLGHAFQAIDDDYNDVDINDEDLPAKRLEQNTRMAQAIINEFLINGVINVTVATTGTAAAQTGSGTGTIS